VDSLIVEHPRNGRDRLAELLLDQIFDGLLLSAHPITAA
jgi:hypothetical protein